MPKRLANEMKFDLSSRSVQVGLEVFFGPPVVRAHTEDEQPNVGFPHALMILLCGARPTILERE